MPETFNAGFLNISQTVNQELLPSLNISQLASTLQSDIVSTGVDEVFDNLWEAIKITTTTALSIGAFGVKIKSSATLSNPLESITGYLYTDVAGSPGASIGGTTLIKYGSLTTSYSEQLFAISTTLSAATSYWLVLKQSAAPTGGTISIDRGSTGTGLHANSANGTAWNLENNKKCYNIIYGRTYYGVYSNSITTYGMYGNSNSGIGIRGTSNTNYGIYGSSSSGYGIYGISPSNIGVYGTSTSGTGVRGNSTSSYGLYGNSSSGYGIYGNSTTGIGLRGNSDSSYGIYGSSTTDIGVYADINPATTNTFATVAKFFRKTSGTAAAGIGGSLNFTVENGSGNEVTSVRIGAVLTVVDSGVEVADMVVYTKPSSGATTETMRVTGAGQLSVNNIAPNASAILSATSTTRGFLPPVMTSTQRAAISTPAEGLVVYDTTLHKLCVFTTVWEAVTSVAII